jgi:actin-related protein 2
MHSSNCTPIVCDVGSGSIKIGYANSRAPAQIIPSVVGHIANGNYKFGKEAILNRDKTPCSFPIQGTIKWDEMELLISHAIDEVAEANVYSRNSILVTEPSLNPIKNKKRMAEILFETMDFDRINISNQAILVLYAQGLLSGIVIDCGESVSQVVPVFEGFVPNHLVKRFSITGRHITKYLSSLLQLRSNSKSVSDMVTVQDIKEKLCYAAHDLEQDRRLARDTTVLVENYVLPDGTTVKVGREKFECTEALFDPSLIDMECAGLSDFVFDTIQECDISTRKQFYEHIVLS